MSLEKLKNTCINNYNSLVPTFTVPTRIPVTVATGVAIPTGVTVAVATGVAVPTGVAVAVAAG
uniref:hypothetical protein n=1 Tax=uncultured Roseibium sp. TaxID=1936171 RepID=UPI002605DD14